MVRAKKTNCSFENCNLGKITGQVENSTNITHLADLIKFWRPINCKQQQQMTFLHTQPTVQRLNLWSVFSSYFFRGHIYLQCIGKKLVVHFAFVSRGNSSINIHLWCSKQSIPCFQLPLHLNSQRLHLPLSNCSHPRKACNIAQFCFCSKSFLGKIWFLKETFSTVVLCQEASRCRWVSRCRLAPWISASCAPWVRCNMKYVEYIK